jgi:hypothetical protein
LAETTYDVDQDLREAAAMAKDLTAYVQGRELYGRVGKLGLFGARKMPALTIGALLLRLDRLRALSDQLSDAQRQQLAEIEAAHEQTRREWAVHYHEKLLHEAKSRLKAMDVFFEECHEQPRICANAYLPEVLRRTIVEAIYDALVRTNQPSEEIRRLMRKADSGLRQYTEPSDFVWAEALRPLYPPEKYWWLYRRPPRPNSKPS